MVREIWWSLAGNKSGINKPRRRGKRVREVFLGPEIVLSGELKSCGTLVAEGIVDGSRIECRRSEERRVGKEWRWGGWGAGGKKQRRTEEGGVGGRVEMAGGV